VVSEDLITDITFAAGEEEGTQVVTFKASSAKLTKEQAIEAIGDAKDRFVVKTFEKVKDADKPVKKS